MGITLPTDHDLSVLLSVMDTAGVAVALLDSEGVVLVTNETFARVCGRPSGELLGVALADSIIADDRQACREMISESPTDETPSSDQTEPASTDARFVGADGRVRPVRLNIAPVYGDLARDSGVHRALLCVASDRGSERRRERADRKARVLETTGEMTDPSTGLLNQRGIDMTLESASRRAGRNESAFAVIRCEISAGSANGNESPPGSEAPPPAHAEEDVQEEALMACLDRVRQRLRPSDTIARIGDSLIVVAEDLGDEQDAAGVTYRILSTVVEPVPTSVGLVPLAMVAGIAVANGSTPLHKLIAEASDAAAAARDAGGFELIDLRRPQS